MSIVSDTSLLILLAKIGLLDLLREWFGEVAIPVKVDRELAPTDRIRPDGVIVLSRQARLIAEARPLLMDLQASGLYLTDAVRAALHAAVGALQSLASYEPSTRARRRSRRP